MIRHLVISGGGHTGLQSLGILQELEKSDFWKLKNIQSIYATSSGTILSILISLGFEWETINDYIIKRPWNETYDIKPLQFLNIFTKKGILDISAIEIFFSPFFKAKDIPITISMMDFFLLTNIDCHFYTIDLNTFELIDLSYSTHPDLPIVHAVYMSSTIPFVLIPLYSESDNKCFVDGGLLVNYPIQQAIDHIQTIDHIQEKETYMKSILGIRAMIDHTSKKINESSSILDYVNSFIHNLISLVHKDTKDLHEKITEISYDGEIISFQTMKDMIYSSEKRKEWIDNGIDVAKKYLYKNEKDKDEDEDKDEDKNKDKDEDNL
jgi:predicted acylesterase/phospholipase RssA